METKTETNNVSKNNMVKNPSRQQADQLAVYKCDRGVELGTTKN